MVQDGEVYMVSDLTTRMWNRTLKLNSSTQILFMKKSDDEKLPKVLDLAAHQDESDLSRYEFQAVWSAGMISSAINMLMTLEESGPFLSHLFRLVHFCKP